MLISLGVYNMQVKVMSCMDGHFMENMSWQYCKTLLLENFFNTQTTQLVYLLHACRNFLKMLWFRVTDESEPTNQVVLKDVSTLEAVMQKGE